MARKIAVEIVGDAASLEKAYKRATDSTKRFNGDVSRAGKAHSSVFGGVGKIAGAAAGLAGIGGLGEAFKASYEEMQDSQKVAAQTGAVLKSTGDASHVSAGHVDELATSLMKKSGVDDEVVKSGENMLLTFTNIRNEAGKGNDVFDQATGTMMDMSTALGEDAPKAAMQLGKALNDPVKGVTALQRVGVQFTGDQKKQIRAMVESGNEMGAQKLILHELNKEFGGSAAAAGKTLPGKLNILKETFKNLGGTVMTQLAPQIQQVAGQMITWLSNTQNQKQIVDLFKGAVDALKTGVNFLKDAFGFLSGVMGGNKKAIELLAGVYAGFKVLKFADHVTTLFNNFSQLATVLFGEAIPATEAEAAVAGEATLATEGLSFALGPAVLGLAAAAAGAALGTLLMQIKPVRDAFFDLGDTIASALGVGAAGIHQMKVPSQAIVTEARQQAGFQEAAGLSRPSVTAALVRQFHIDPAAARIISGEAAGRNAPVHFHIQNQYVTAHDPRGLVEATQRHARQKPQVR